MESDTVDGPTETAGHGAVVDDLVCDLRSGLGADVIQEYLPRSDFGCAHRRVVGIGPCTWPG